MAYPEAELHVLVFEKTEGVLEGNTDLDQIITMPEKPDRKTFFSIIRKLFRKYDLTVNVQGSDRACLLGLLSSRKYRIGIIPSMRKQDAWKRLFLDKAALLDDVHTHTVVQNLLLMSCLGKEAYPEVIIPNTAQTQLNEVLSFNPGDKDYVVLHPFPKFKYKEWNRQAWLELIEYLVEKKITVLISGSPVEEEKQFCEALAHEAGNESVISIAGKTRFSDLAVVIKKAKVYVGPDTVVTHLAAATGTKTMSLFGPGNPEKWGPWPVGEKHEQLTPWKNKAERQEAGNVIILQGSGDCVPCHQEGCDRHTESLSLCLQNMSAQRVIEELKTIF
jgi:heptosyltransferase-3